jgi:hypothetical protein
MNYLPLTFNNSFSVVFENTIVLCTLIITFIYISVCTVHLFEFRFRTDEGPGLPLPKAFYFIIVTLSTVGYGDITPSTVYTEMLLVVIILYAIIVIPPTISSLVDALAVQKSRGGVVGEDFGGTKGSFVVIVGNFDSALRLNLVLDAFLEDVSFNYFL